MQADNSAVGLALSGLLPGAAGDQLRMRLGALLIEAGIVDVAQLVNAAECGLALLSDANDTVPGAYFPVVQSLPDVEVPEYVLSGQPVGVPMTGGQVFQWRQEPA